MKQWLGAMCGALLLTANTQAADTQSMVQHYVHLGNEIMDMANSGEVSTSAVEEKVVELTKVSVALSEAYAARFPEGKALLDFVAGKVAKLNGHQVTGLGTMAELSFDEIQTEWHDLAYFRGHEIGVDMDDEDNEHFTDPLHVMIHPIMVYRAAKDLSLNREEKHLDRMKAEMAEGVEQVKIVADVLTH